MCSERQQMLFAYCDAITATAQQFAQESALPARKRVRTKAANEAKLLLAAKLERHARDHRCGRQQPAQPDEFPFQLAALGRALEADGHPVIDAVVVPTL